MRESLQRYIGRAVASMLVPYLRFLEKQIMATQAEVDAITARIQAVETKLDNYTPPTGVAPANDLDLTALDAATTALEGSTNAKFS